MSKLAQPDTDADRSVRECISTDRVRSFAMTAGAGSGKTTSLVKALAQVVNTRGPSLRARGQRVACITYTEIAVGEIREEVGRSALVHVSTIHSFLWTVGRSFQHDIRSWVAGRIESKIATLRETLEKPRIQAKTREKATREITRLQKQQAVLSLVPRFRYGTGADYLNGVLGHDDIITMVPELILHHELLQDIVAQRFPFVFVDESQDTAESVIRGLECIEERRAGDFCLGLFGDAMQKIYTTGIGTIPSKERWTSITKPENFRCPATVLSVVNAIRKGGDGLVQSLGDSARMRASSGTAHLFVLPSIGSREARLRSVRQWMAERNCDPLWLSDERGADVRVLVVVHRMAAKRLGFEQLYAALNDDAPSSIKDGVTDGTAWPVTPLLSFVLPLVLARETARQFDVIDLLRTHSPRMRDLSNPKSDVALELSDIGKDVDSLVRMLADASTSTVGDVLRFVVEKRLCELGERFAAHMQPVDAGSEDARKDADVVDAFAQEVETIEAFLQCPAKQLRGYRTYVEDESPFATQQGIKGAEFARVLVVVDDEEGTHPHFSYDKLFGLLSPSATDLKNRAEGKDTTIDRTRRLFYVCCSRAMQDLAVAVFAIDPAEAMRAIASTGYFADDSLHQLT